MHTSAMIFRKSSLPMVGSRDTMGARIQIHIGTAELLTEGTKVLREMEDRNSAIT